MDNPTLASLFLLVSRLTRNNVVNAGCLNEEKTVVVEDGRCRNLEIVCWLRVAPEVIVYL